MNNRFVLVAILSFLLTLAGNAQDAFVVDSFRLAIEQSDSEQKKVESLHALSKYVQKYNLSDGEEYAIEALEIAKKQKNHFLKVKAHIELGTLYIRLGRYVETFKHYNIAQEYFDQNSGKNQALAIRLYNNTGALYDRLEEYDKALESYFRALALVNQGVEMPDTYGFPAGLYNNIASIYEIQNDNKKAIDYYKKALSSAEAANDIPNLGSINNNIGKIYIKANELKLAKEYLNRSLQIRTESHDKLGTAKSLYFLSNYFLKIRELDSAFQYAFSSHQLANELDHLETLCYSAMFLSEASDSLKRPSEALRYHRLYKTLSDSIINSEKVKELSNLQKSYELEEIQSEAAHAQQLLKIKYIAITSFLLLCIAIMLLLFISVRYKKNKIQLLNKQLGQDIEMKNRELTTNVMYLVKKNELINSVAKRLVSISDSAKSENKKTIQQIIFDLNQEVDKDVWQDFEFRFNQVHNNFYEKLRESHPDLSPADIRLCAFLRLNLSSKEIAAITSQSAGSIDVARARLRKKLELTNTDKSLVNYLLKFE